MNILKLTGSVLFFGGGVTLKAPIGQAFTGKYAFTLSEVLLTLGIIGIIAAMTLPTITANIKGRQNVAKFRKSLATLSNAARMSQSLYGFDYGGISEKCNANSASDNPESKFSVCALLNGTLSGATYYYGNVAINYNPDSTMMRGWSSFSNLAKNPIYVLSDGTILLLSSQVGKKPCTGANKSEALTYIEDNGGKYGTACYGVIDVNGTAPPNKDVKCTTGSNKSGNIGAINCKVKPKDINDIFPIIFHDGIVEPYTDAGAVVLMDYK